MPIYTVYSPGGNITALVNMEAGVNLSALARQIMAGNRAVEQVGFLGAPKLPGMDFHLEMMGGEFCGNAARCAALHVSGQKNKTELSFTVSGFDLPVSARVVGREVALLLPGQFLRQVTEVRDGWLVDFEGIRFLVMDKSLPSAGAKRLIKSYLGDFPAFGIVASTGQGNSLRIDPLVWVESTQTLTPETACASGSLAAAVVQRLKNPQADSYLVIQPSGSTYQVGLIGQAGITDKLALSGEVSVVK